MIATLGPEANLPTEPARDDVISAGLMTGKALGIYQSFTLEKPKSKSAAKAKPKAGASPLIIGFDVEWVTERPDPLDDEDSADDAGYDADRVAPDQIPRNHILSYQYACRFKGREWSGIFYTRLGARLRWPNKSEVEIARHPERITLKRLLGIAIAQGTHDKHLRKWPEQVIAAAHWTRADLSAMADFSSIKCQFDGVQKTYVTLKRPYQARVNAGGHPREFRVYLLDTQLLVPGSARSLAALGDLYEFPKLDPGHRYLCRSDGVAVPCRYIERMDWLLADDPWLYERYAIRDAEISALHIDHMLRFIKDELGLRRRIPPPPTLGSLAVKHLLKGWDRHGVDADAVLDGRFERTKRFDPNRRCYVRVWERKHTPRFNLNSGFAAQCFHGGRNECFCYGPTIDTEAAGTPPFRELDLVSAYPVALASIRMPDWEGMYDSTDPVDFGAGVLGIARVRFCFPPDTRFPSLPVEAPNDHGLIYPLEGEAYATASEIAVARSQGAKIDILDGVIVPWRDDATRPFLVVIKDLLRRRQEHDKGTLQSEMFKLLANSLYGKQGQGIKGTTAYDTRTDTQKKIRPCNITNPYLAAYITGLIRALISELLAGIPRHRSVISVTTDAFITNAEMTDVDQNGPIAGFLADVKLNLTGDRTLLETKYAARQLLPWRTRGVATLKRNNGDKPKLARGGMREPAGTRPDQANDWFARKMLLRRPGDSWSIKEPLPFSSAHRANADHVFRQHSRKVNFEFDMKRRPMEPQSRYIPLPDDPDTIVQHIAFDTVPWRTVEDFSEARERFDEWRLKSAAPA